MKIVRQQNINNKKRKRQSNKLLDPDTLAELKLLIIWTHKKKQPTAWEMSRVINKEQMLEHISEYGGWKMWRKALDT